METAKVDIRKLQLLNDRIAHLLDALQQVRLSVHGLQHTGPVGPGIAPQQGGMYPGASPYATAQLGGYPPGMAGGYGAFGHSAIAPWQQIYGGLSHSGIEAMEPWNTVSRVAIDPVLRYGQTFPNVFAPIAPVGF